MKRLTINDLSDCLRKKNLPRRLMNHHILLLFFITLILRRVYKSVILQKINQYRLDSGALNVNPISIKYEWYRGVYR